MNVKLFGLIVYPPFLSCLCGVNGLQRHWVSMEFSAAYVAVVVLKSYEHLIIFYACVRWRATVLLPRFLMFCRLCGGELSVTLWASIIILLPPSGESGTMTIMKQRTFKPLWRGELLSYKRITCLSRLRGGEYLTQLNPIFYKLCRLCGGWNAAAETVAGLVFAACVWVNKPCIINYHIHF